MKEYLSQKGIATSRTTPYHPIGNSQCERYNEIVWKSIQLTLKSHSLPDSQWEMVLPDALHSIRSLLQPPQTLLLMRGSSAINDAHRVAPQSLHGYLHQAP